MTEIFHFPSGERGEQRELSDVDDEVALDISLGGVLSTIGRRRDNPEPVGDISSLTEHRRKKLQSDSGPDGSRFRHPAGKKLPPDIIA